MLLEDLRIAVVNVIEKKRRFLKEEFGDDSDYPIKGVVVVGSVATREEKPSSDIDLLVLSDGEGYFEDFVQLLTQELKTVSGRKDLELDVFGTIRIDLGERFEPQTWAASKERESFHNGYEVIEASL